VHVEKTLTEGWDKNSQIQEKWDSLRSALSDAAEEVLGREDKRQPDWFRENETAIKPLIAERNC
jgi:hypothetical protein